MSKKIEITLHPREAEMLIEHLAGQNHYPEVALKVADQCVEQLSYPDATPTDWANDVRNLAYLRAAGAL